MLFLPSSARQVNAFTVVRFGGLGDYSEHYIGPGASNALGLGLVPGNSMQISVDTHEQTQSEHIDWIMAHNPPVPRARMEQVARYVQMDVTNADDYRDKLAPVIAHRQAAGRIVYWAAVPPNEAKGTRGGRETPAMTLYEHIARGIRDSGLAQGDFVVLFEKPIGMNRATALRLKAHLERILGKGHVLFVDHYLAKWTIFFNVRLGRLAESLGEGNWDGGSVAEIRIEGLEADGVGTLDMSQSRPKGDRMGFFDPVGLGGDVGQSHQFLVAAELAREPAEEPAAVTAARLEAMRNMHLPTPDVAAHTVWGRYSTYAAELEAHCLRRGAPVRAPGPNSETLYGVEFEVRTPRWATPGGGYTRWVFVASKRTRRKQGRIVITYHSGRVHTIPLHLEPAGAPRPHALLFWALAQQQMDTSLFVGDEILEGWRFWDPLREYVAAHPEVVLPYEPGVEWPEFAARFMAPRS